MAKHGQAQDILFIHSPQLEDYSYPEGNPFNLRRAGMVLEKARSYGLLDGPHRRHLVPAPAPLARLEEFHHPRYLEALAAEGEGFSYEELGEMGLGTPDCPLFPGLLPSAAIAAGGTLAGAAEILARRARIAFNPSGGFHHAWPRRASGFCYVNDLVPAIRDLAAAGRRVLFLDIDVHHGDAVQFAFYDDPRVLTLSLHESGRNLFPGTGEVAEVGRGEGLGFSVNVPLPPGTYDLAYWKAFKEVVPPLVEAFAPDVIVLEIGMDALAGDPLAHLDMTNNIYADVIDRVLAFHRPILATGGGGYNLANTVRGWTLAWSVLCGEDDGAEMSMGLGGVMLESRDWQGGLRDRQRFVHAQDRAAIDAAIDTTIAEVKRTIFPLHGL